MFVNTFAYLTVNMEQKHRDLLTNKLVYLVANLDLVATHLLDYLYTDGLLRDTDIQEIEVGIRLFHLIAASVCLLLFSISCT